MISEVILCKFGEIVLKGANRKFFESMLNREVKRRMYLYGPCEVRASQSTITIDPKTDTFDIEGAYEEVKKIFGLVGVSRALKVEKDMDKKKTENLDGVMIEDIIKNCRPQTKLCIAANLTCDDEFVRTRTVKEWRGNIPELSKIPCIFLLYK